MSYSADLRFVGRVFQLHVGAGALCETLDRAQLVTATEDRIIAIYPG
jgi:hypothetical protein